MKEHYTVCTKRTFYELSLKELTNLLNALECIDDEHCPIQIEIGLGTNDCGIYNKRYFLTISSSCGGLRSIEDTNKFLKECLEDINIEIEA